MYSFRGLRRRLKEGISRLHESGWAMLQTALAASVAYLLAEILIQQERPFFAPVAAVLTLSVALGQRGRRAFEIALGVAVGIGVADLLVLVIGTGALQIALVVILAMAATVFFGGSMLLVNQAAVSALLVVVLQPPDAGFTPDRLIAALIGSAVALAVNYLFPANPERLVLRAARPLFAELVSTLEEVAAAMRAGDLDWAERTLSKARKIDERVVGFQENLAAGYETARFSPPRRRALGHLRLYSAAERRIDLTVRNVRSVARASASAVRRGSPALEPLSDAVVDLAGTVRALDVYLERSGDPGQTRRLATSASEKATAVLKEHQDLSTSVLVGQIRTTAVDLLIGTGMDPPSALQALERQPKKSR
ncbi:MAG: aromatic acid exporter family protein [Rubrobacteraceae bacterium]